MANKPNLENFLNLSLDRVMSDRFGRYSKYIIQDRALPDSRDGLKPVQRRILYSMQDLGLTYNKAYKKSARVVGDVIGKYHPHGDSSIYEAMVRMSQDWKMNIPLIQMHGNNGSIDDDPAAAMRYTEARLSKISKELLNNIKKETVLFVPNFDDSEKEPTVLPALFPNLLTNGAKGIAAGYATEMPPHNLSEVIDATIAKIKSPNIRLDTLLNYIKGPDFPTGGIIQGTDGIYQAFERGRGRIVIRSKYEIIDLKTKPAITISEIPYGVIKAKLVRDIDEIRFNNKISGIKEVRDETDRTGLRIVIELTAGTNPRLVEKYLLQKTDLQIYYNYNNVAIQKKIPTTMGLIQLIDSYLDHQRDVQTKALNFDLSKYKRRLEIIEGLIKVATITDQVIETIKKAEGSRSGVISDLQSKYGFTELQASAIAELRLYRLSRTDQSLYHTEAAELNTKIKEISDILATPDHLDKYLIQLLKELKKEYGESRKTVIVGEIEAISVNLEELIKHEDVWVGVSKDGYIKRFSNRAYEANELDTYALKENDSLKALKFMNTSDRLLVFTNKGHYYFLPVHRIVETKYKEIGKHINDFAAIPVDEKIINAVPVSDFTLKANIVQVTKLGRAKSTLVKDFEVSRYTKTYKSFKLIPGDEVVDVKISHGFNEIIIVTTDGKAVRYNESFLASQGTSASGSRAINLKDNAVASFVIAHGDDTIGLVSKRGGMKRIKVANIMPMSKTTKGKTMFREIKGNPHIISNMAVATPQTKALYFTKEIIIKTFGDVDITSPAEGLSLIGPPQTIEAKILTFAKIDKDSSELKLSDKNISETAKFKKAEKAIDALDQLSLDDLLDGIE